MRKFIAALLVACSLVALVPQSVAAQPTAQEYDTYLTTVFVGGGTAAVCQAINTQMAVAYGMITYLSSLGMGILTGTFIAAPELLAWYAAVAILTTMWTSYGCANA